MALDINGYNSAFRTFVDFAQMTHKDGYDSAARSTERPQSDATRSLASWWRTRR